MCHFLHLDPLADRKLFTRTIERPVKEGDPMGLKRLQASDPLPACLPAPSPLTHPHPAPLLPPLAQLLMARVALRRTKSTRVGGRPLVALPPRSVQLVQVELLPEARAKYQRWQAAGERSRWGGGGGEGICPSAWECACGWVRAAPVARLCTSPPPHPRPPTHTHTHTCAGRALVARHLQAGTLLANYTAVLEVLLRLRQVGDWGGERGGMSVRGGRGREVVGVSSRPFANPRRAMHAWMHACLPALPDLR